MSKDTPDTRTTLDPEDVVAWWVEAARASGFVVVQWQVRRIHDLASGRLAGRS